MLSWRKPSAEDVQRRLHEQAQLDLTYAAVGATATSPPAGYVVDHTRVRLGAGECVFQAARAALQRWDQLRLGWLEAVPAEAPIETGQVVGILARAAGLWWLNACRIVYVIDQVTPACRFGFGYGTLPDHAGTGEERFLIEWNPEDNGVWYDILAFSRPHQLLIRLGYPLVRRTQKRFGQDSARALRRVVTGGSPGDTP